MSEMLTQFHFLRPTWFLALIPAAILLAALRRRHLGESRLEKICEPVLLAHLLLGQGHGVKKNPLALLAAAWLLAVIALAGPVWKQQPQPTYRLGSGRVLVLDLSPSMAATDITPSRLARARYKLNDILGQSREGRTGLVVFSGEPHVVAPLTDDVATIASLLPALAIDIMPAYGDAAGPALDMAASLLKQEGVKEGDIVLITDGIEDLAGSVAKASGLRQTGISLSVLGIGTQNGAPVPNPAGGGFIADGTGAPRLSRLDIESLQGIASAGGGRYSSLTADEQDINYILSPVHRNMLSPGKGTDKNIERWQEEGVWLVLPILLLTLAGFRKGWLVVAVFLFLTKPGPARAMNWQDLWQRPDQQAAELLADGNALKAAEIFSDPAWRAVAQHKAGDYQAAMETGKNASNAVDLYNLGNSMARAGQFEEALSAYEKAMKLNPADEDAEYNRDLIKKLMEQQKKEQQQDGSGDTSDDLKQPDDKGQENQKQQGQEPEKKEGQRPDDQSSGQDQNSGKNHDAGKDQGAQEQEDQGKKDINKSPEQGEKEQPAKEREEAGAKQQEVQAQSNSDNNKHGESLPEQRQVSPTPASPDDQEKEMTNDELILEQWLRQVPDDPSGLLRRKFMLEHQRRLQPRK